MGVENEVRLIERRVAQDVGTAYSWLTSKKINLGLMVLILAVVIGAGWIISNNNAAYEKAMAKAEQREEQYRQDTKALVEELKRSADERVAMAEQQKANDRVIVVRDNATNARVADVMTPDRAAEIIAKDVQDAYNFSPVAIDPATRRFTFSAPQTQIFVATKFDRDRLEANYGDLQKNMELEQKKTASLTEDLTKSEAHTKECELVVADYKKVSKKSKLKKIFDNPVTKVVIFVGGVYLGKKL